MATVQGEPDVYARASFNMGMSYGLIVAVSVLLATPRITFRGRLFLASVAVLVSFLSHLAGLYLFLQRLESAAANAAHLAQVVPQVLPLLRDLPLAWLTIPSLIWLPVLLRSWRPVGARTRGRLAGKPPSRAGGERRGPGLARGPG